MLDNKKVLVIGATGLVGMATSEAITERLGIDVIQYSQPIKASEHTKEREERKKRYSKLVGLKNRSVDGQHEKWLYHDLQKKTGIGSEVLSDDKHGKSQEVDSITDGVKNDVDCIVITSGKPRKTGMERERLTQLNAPYFVELGEELAKSFVEQIKKNSDFKMPVIMNTGNPVDTVTELLARSLSDNLIKLSYENSAQEWAIKKIAADVPNKVIGQGGVLDCACAAIAIAELSNNDPHNIQASVVGPHNPDMLIDWDNVHLTKYNKEIELTIDKEKAKENTVNSGNAFMKNYEALGLQDQSVVFATAAALANMVDNVVHDRGLSMPVSAHNPEGKSGDGKTSMMGRMTTFGKDGISKIAQPSRNLKNRLAIAEENAVKAFQKAVSINRSL